jgi:HTH-type transcriptional regulator / antitoxin HigA
MTALMQKRFKDYVMNIKPIKTEADYESALKEIETLFGAEPGTPKGDQLDILITLVEAYENEHYPIPQPDPIEAIHYYMETRELSRIDLEEYIGSRARVSEILNRKRALTLSMIQRLYEGLGIPAEVLVQPYKLASAQSKSSHRQRIPVAA